VAGGAGAVGVGAAVAGGAGPVGVGATAGPAGPDPGMAVTADSRPTVTRGVAGLTMA
jgi:hypothetical protein